MVLDPGVEVQERYPVGRVDNGTLGHSRALAARRDLHDMDEVRSRYCVLVQEKLGISA